MSFKLLLHNRHASHRCQVEISFPMTENGSKKKTTNTQENPVLRLCVPLLGIIGNTFRIVQTTAFQKKKKKNTRQLFLPCSQHDTPSFFPILSLGSSLDHPVFQKRNRHLYNLQLHSSKTKTKFFSLVFGSNPLLSHATTVLWKLWAGIK